MPDVFLSYNREDQAVARRFAEAFTAQGLDVWWDTALKSGEAYDEVTETALRTAKAVVVLWSKKSVASRWVRAEATLADRNKTLVPCMIEACERPIMFELTQTAELSHWQGNAGDNAWAAFLGDVRRFVAKSAPASSSLASAAPVATRKLLEPILAVLAFDNLSADSELQFFSDGVAEEILSVIARAPGIRVIGSNSSFSFRGERKKDAARALGASHVLDGSVRRGGARVRISAQLTEASTGQVLWTEKFDRELTDALAVQDEIAAETAKALEAKLAPAQPKTQIDPQAYDLYLRAIAIRKSPDAPAQHKAIAYLEAAIAIEPDFTRAHGALALTLCQKIVEATLFGSRGEAFGEAMAQVRAAAQRALALDPNDPEARLAALSLEPITENWRAQGEAFEHLRDGAPNDLALRYHYGRWLQATGRFREGSNLLARGFEADPVSPTWMATKAMLLWDSGDQAAADELSAKAYAKAPSNLLAPNTYRNMPFNWAFR